MPTTDTLQPGTVTTLSALRPGDVGEFTYNPDGGRFVVIAMGPVICWIQYEHDPKPHSRYRNYPVRYLGRGRIEPARIVMEELK